MTSTSGTFTAPGVSGALAATATVSVSLTGIAHRCDVTLEQSLDDGTTWTTYDAGMIAVVRPIRSTAIVGAVDEASYGNGFAMQWSPAPAGQYRLRCTRFDSGFCAYTLSAT